MNGRQIQLLETIANALMAADGLKLRSAAVSSATGDLRAVYERILKLQTRQAAPQAGRGFTARQRDLLRHTLREKHLFVIQKRGRLLLKGLPGVRDSLRVPHRTARDEELLKAAQRIADTVRPHAKVFVAAKFRKDFIRQLERAAAALSAAATTGVTPARGFGRVTADLKEAFVDARLALDALDAQLVAELEPGSVPLAQWKKAKRVRRRMGRPRRRAARTRTPASAA